MVLTQHGPSGETPSVRRFDHSWGEQAVGISDRCERVRCTACTIPILDYSFVVLIFAFQIHIWYLYCLHALYR